MSCKPCSAPSITAKLCTCSNWFQLYSPTNPNFLLSVSGFYTFDSVLNDVLCLYKLVDSSSLISLAQTDFAVTVQVMKSISFLSVLFYSHSGSSIKSLSPPPLPQCHASFPRMIARLFSRHNECLNPTLFDHVFSWHQGTAQN